METTSGLKSTEQPRKHLTAELRVYYGPSQNKILYGFSVDMSTGGLFLKTETPFSVNEKVMLSFTLPDVKKVVNCSAKVAWVNLQDDPRKPEFPAGVGLQFMDLSIEYLTSIQNLLKDEGVESMSEPEK
jgi:uncharacterized protein (TIGR02266 family)